MDNSAVNDELLMEAEAAFDKQMEGNIKTTQVNADVQLIKNDQEIQDAIAEVDQQESEVAQKPASYGISELRVKVRTMIKKMIEDEFDQMIKKLGLEE